MELGLSAVQVPYRDLGRCARRAGIFHSTASNEKYARRFLSVLIAEKRILVQKKRAGSGARAAKKRLKCGMVEDKTRAPKEPLAIIQSGFQGKKSKSRRFRPD
jgi:hypothetical protein